MSHPRDFAWTEEADAELRRLLENGDSASTAAAKMSTAFAVDLSRSAVMGRAHRKGFPLKWKWRARSKVKPEPTKVKRIQPAVCARASVPAAPEPPIDLSPTMRFFDRLSSDCAWIEGVPSFEAMCCGRPVIDGRAYCLVHCGRAYSAPGNRGRVEKCGTSIAKRLAV